MRKRQGPPSRAAKQDFAPVKVAESQANEPARQASDAETQAALIRYSYEQVLDATKHQDDKVGRLLTSIAFLTAASLALASLGGARAISTPVNLAGNEPGVGDSVAIGFMCLVVFLACVTLTVIQLIGSLSTPLRLPGLDPARQDPKTSSVPSTIYFHEIEKNTRDEWGRIWKSPVNVLQSGRTESMIYETLNLARRTSFKYNRTNEATAVFTGALIALSLTVAFAAIALLNGSYANTVEPRAAQKPIVLSSSDMLLIGSLLLAVTFVWSSARYRHSRVGRETDQKVLVSRIQLAVVYGCALSVFWVAGLPLLFETHGWWVYGVGAGFLSMFTAASMAWSTWARTDFLGRVRAGRWIFINGGAVVLGVLGCWFYSLWGFQDFWRALPWATGVISGSVLATLFAWLGAKIDIHPERRRTESTKHEDPWPNCDVCYHARRAEAAKRVWWRVAAILVIAGSLSFMAQQFQLHQAYIWPLSAACAALAALIVSAVLEPTLSERSEQRRREQRKQHNDAMQPGL